MRRIVAVVSAALAVGSLVVVGIMFLLPSIDGSSAPSAGGSSAPSASTPTAMSPTPEAHASQAGGGGPKTDKEAPTEADEFDRSRHSTTDPASIWVVVNKTHPIRPKDFRPEIEVVRGYQVATPVAEPLGRLLADSDELGLGFKIASAFRSYDYQERVHANVVTARGQEAADQVSARPGHSEHQTGLAVDLVTPDNPECNFEVCFGETPGGEWLAANAWRYGFIIRYQADSTDITGYGPEPWHLRYVGKPLAAELRRSGIATLEEFFDIPGGRL
jgi:D-alanyl-D-alanine carboxypeptidase